MLFVEISLFAANSVYSKLFESKFVKLGIIDKKFMHYFDEYPFLLQKAAAVDAAALIYYSASPKMDLVA